MSTAAAPSAVHARRRRRAVAPPPPPVQPVPGTQAARTQQAQEAQRVRTPAAQHVLLDPDPRAKGPGPRVVGLTKGMSPDEHADRIVAELLKGTGPILLCAPGTIAGPFDATVRAAARAFIRQSGTSVSVASIPYSNGVIDCVTRYMGLGKNPDANVLALVLRRLIAANTGRSILLLGESQGSWLVADTLRAEPALAAAVTRVALVSKPAFVQMPDAVGAARHGAAMLPGTVPGHTGVVEWRHTDDIVASLFHRMNLSVPKGWIDAVGAWMQTGHFGYPPHTYSSHGEDIAAWLLRAERPDVSVHHSREDAIDPRVPAATTAA